MNLFSQAGLQLHRIRFNKLQGLYEESKARNQQKHDVDELFVSSQPFHHSNHDEQPIEIEKVKKASRDPGVPTEDGEKGNGRKPPSPCA